VFFILYSKFPALLPKYLISPFVEAIFPAQNITVELYKDGNLLFSSEKDKNGELFAANPGKPVVKLPFSSKEAGKTNSTSSPVGLPL